MRGEVLSELLVKYWWSTLPRIVGSRLASSEKYLTNV